MKMTIEEKLKALILIRYNSIREFVLEIGIPYSTLNSVFLRGVNNSSIATIVKICKALGLSVDALADGKIEYTKEPRPINDRIEIKELLSHTKEVLTANDFITLNGKPATDEDIKSIIETIEIAENINKK